MFTVDSRAEPCFYVPLLDHITHCLHFTQKHGILCMRDKQMEILSEILRRLIFLCHFRFAGRKNLEHSSNSATNYMYYYRAFVGLERAHENVLK